MIRGNRGAGRRPVPMLRSHKAAHAAAPFAPQSLPGLAWQVGFGASFYKDAAKSTPATADGDLVYNASDAVAGKDLIQPISRNRPILDGATWPGKKAILFRSWLDATISTLGSNQFRFNPQSCTIAAVYKVISIESRPGPGTLLFFGGPSSTPGYWWTSNSYPRPFYNGGAPGPVIPPNDSRVTVEYGSTSVVMIGTPTSWTVRLNGVEVYRTAGSPWTDSSGFTLCNAPGQSVHASFLGAMVYTTAFSGADLNALEIYLRGFNVGTTFPRNAPAFVTVGDSLTQGAGASDELHTWPQQMLTSMTSGDTFRRSFANMAIGGETSAQWNLYGAALVDPYQDAARPRNILFYWCGTNDLDSGTYGRVKAFCQARKALGWTVVCVDVLPRGGFPDSVRAAHNAALASDFPTAIAANVRSGASYADYLVQVSGDPDIGHAGQFSNTTYYQPDQTHLTDAGYAIIAGHMKVAMVALGYA
jgi:lysophospholipase L1-like esterase